MTTITKQLADALRAALPYAENESSAIHELADDGDEHAQEECETAIAAIEAAREALAAYDAFMLGVAEAHSDVTTHVGPDLIEVYDEGRASVRDALAQAELPTEFRVTTEWDAFNATTPREAALEVWEAIKTSSGPVFTVYGRDGSVTDIDLEVDA